MRILLTRPIEDSVRTVKALQTLGHEALVAPLFEIKPLAYALNAEPDIMLATSANALRTCRLEDFAPWLALPFFAVGDATANAARAFGFSHVISAAGDSIALAALIQSKVAHGASVLQLAGKPRRDAAIQALERCFKLSTIETYETVACASLPEAIAHGLNNQTIHAVMHFSPRAAKVFMDLVQAAGLEDIAGLVRHISISEAASDARLRNVILAERPTFNAMLEAISAL